jgi:hypothetical protein
MQRGLVITFAASANKARERAAAIGNVGEGLSRLQTFTRNLNDGNAACECGNAHRRGHANRSRRCLIHLPFHRSVAP